MAGAYGLVAVRDIGWRAAGPVRQAGVVITMQRVRVRWSAAARGAEQANARRGLCRPVMLPLPMPGDDDVLIHEVVADEAAGYVRAMTRLLAAA